MTKLTHIRMQIKIKKRKRESIADRISERSALVIYSIINEIKSLEEELDIQIVENYKGNASLEFETFTDEQINIFRKHGRKIINFGESVYIPFSISELIKEPALNPLESIAVIYMECESWLGDNNFEV